MILTVLVPGQPGVFSPLTVYDVVTDGVTELELVVAVVFHVYVVAPEAVKLTDVQLQTVVCEAAKVTFGAAQELFIFKLSIARSSLKSP